MNNFSELYNFLNLENNFYYFLSLKILIGIFLLEIFTIFIGGILNFIDSKLSTFFDFLDNSDFVDNIEIDLDISSSSNINTELYLESNEFLNINHDLSLLELSTFDKVIHWLNLGKVPLIIYLTFLFSSFGLIGLELTYIDLFNNYINLFITIVVSIIVTKWLSGKLGNYLKIKESDKVVNYFSYIGKECKVYDTSFVKIGRGVVNLKIQNSKNKDEIVNVEDIVSIKFVDNKTKNEDRNLKNIEEQSQNVSGSNLTKKGETLHIIDFDVEDNCCIVVKTLEEVKKHIDKLLKSDNIEDIKKRIVLKQYYINKTLAV